MKNKLKDIDKITVKEILWGITKSGLIHFGLYLLSYGFMNLILYGGQYNFPRDFTIINYYMIILYAVANYYGYVKPYCNKIKLDVTDSAFEPKKELKSYMKDEGKYILVIYGVLAVILELALIFERETEYIIALLLFFIFPMGCIFKFPYNIPVLRSILGYAVTSATTLGVFVFTRYRTYKKWNKKNNNDIK